MTQVVPSVQDVVRAQRLALILVGTLLEDAGAGSLESFGAELAAVAEATAETRPEEGLVLAAWAVMALESAQLMHAPRVD